MGGYIPTQSNQFISPWSFSNLCLHSKQLTAYMGKRQMWHSFKQIEQQSNWSTAKPQYGIISYLNLFALLVSRNIFRQQGKHMIIGAVEWQNCRYEKAEMWQSTKLRTKSWVSTSPWHYTNFRPYIHRSKHTSTCLHSGWRKSPGRHVPLQSRQPASRSRCHRPPRSECSQGIHWAFRSSLEALVLWFLCQGWMHLLEQSSPLGLAKDAEYPSQPWLWFDQIRHSSSLAVTLRVPPSDISAQIPVKTIGIKSNMFLIAIWPIWFPEFSMKVGLLIGENFSEWTRYL